MKDVIDIQVELPQGYNLEQTSEMLNETEKLVATHHEVKHVLTQMGKITELEQGTNLQL